MNIVPKNKGGWVGRENLLPLVLILSKMVSYSFDKVDWIAIEFGIAGSDHENNKWFTYILPGALDLEIRLAKEEGTDLFFFDLMIPEALENNFDFLHYILQDFELRAPGYFK